MSVQERTFAAERLLFFLTIIEKELDFIAAKSSEMVPEWLRLERSVDDWTDTRLAFRYVEHLLTEHRIPPRVHRALETHGLTGQLLESKVSFLKKVSERFHKIYEKHRENMGIARRLSSWVLGVLDNYLDSLANVFVGLGAVREFKEQIESALTSPEELNPA